MAAVAVSQARFDLPTRGVGGLLRSALDEHDRLLSAQQQEFDKRLKEEQSKHSRELDALRSEIAAMRSTGKNQPKVAQGDAIQADSEPEHMTIGLGSQRDSNPDPEAVDQKPPSLEVCRPSHRSSEMLGITTPKSLATVKKLHRLATKSVNKPKSRIRKFVDGPLDSIVCGVIALNTVFLFVQLQFNGQRIGIEEGLITGALMSEGARQTFFFVEVCFNLFFVTELLGRMTIQRHHFLFNETHGGMEALNVFDTFVVIGTTVDLLLQIGDTDSGIMNFSIFRPLRFLRLVRVLRAVNTVRIFLKLRILLSTVACSMMALFWSIVLLFFTLLIASLFMNQAIALTLDDETISSETRLWLFNMYGTSSKAFYTVFELTFSGGWPTYARPLVEEVSPWWACFFFVYIVVVVFAMFRIITALFLRDTLALAANDAETAIQEKLHLQRGIADKLLAFFIEADTSGDGMLSVGEFQAMLQDAKIGAWLGLLEVDASDAMHVFNLVKQDDDMVNADDFVKGMMRIKGQARGQDVFALMQNGKKVNRDLDSLSQSIRKIEASMRSLVREEYA